MFKHHHVAQKTTCTCNNHTTVHIISVHTLLMAGAPKAVCAQVLVTDVPAPFDTEHYIVT